MMRALSYQDLSFGSWTEGIEDENDDCKGEKCSHTLAEETMDDESDMNENDEELSSNIDCKRVQQERDDNTFQIGDHVYSCSKLLYQRHGIVVHIDEDGTLLIADFSELPTCHSEEAEVVCFRFLHQNNNDNNNKMKWHRVLYGATKFQRAISRPGTVTCEVADDPSIVLERVNFLMLHYQLVPKNQHDVLKSSCETIALWCRTGQWRALQLNQLLDVSNTASVVGSGSIATYAAVEGAGMCCLLGAELAVSAPLLLPAIAIGSLAAGGATVWNTNRTRQEWKMMTETLNREFIRFSTQSIPQEVWKYEQGEG